MIYSASKNIRFKTSKLRSNLCDYSDSYIVVKGTITVEGDDDKSPRNIKEIIIPPEKTEEILNDVREVS